MLAIITTHPIQYQVPLWEALEKDGTIPFEVWYLTHHAVEQSHDVQFNKTFAWDLNLLHGYPHRQLKVANGANPTTFFKCRVVESLASLIKERGITVIWVQGWQVYAYWQAVWVGHRMGCKVWMRGESNDLAPKSLWKQPIKTFLLGQLFSRIDAFLCIGTANRQLYLNFGIPESRLFYAPYSVDNLRFATQARRLQPNRNQVRRSFGIPNDAFCALFCGKFILKKNPMDLVCAARLLQKIQPNLNLHLLFVGSGELGDQLRGECHISWDAESSETSPIAVHHKKHSPPASFAGFLNQTEITKAYVAADCLVLPSDYGETWGLVVNEALATGLSCVISDRCGSALDLGTLLNTRTYPFGNIQELAAAISALSQRAFHEGNIQHLPSISQTIDEVKRIWFSTPNDSTFHKA